MANLRPPYRHATPDDALAMAELVNIAGEGLPLYLWTKMAAPDEDPWEIGQQRAKRDSGSFSFRNTIVGQVDDKVVCALIGYPLADTPKPVNYEEMPAMFVPLQELEDLVPGTWYVNVLATYREYRGKGYGSELLAIAEQLAVDTARSGMSLIVSDANVGARRLYKRQGYAQLATRPMVREAWENAGENWVLLAKAF